MAKALAENYSLLTAFSSNGERFAIATPDGRLKIIDTDLGQCVLNLATGSALVLGAEKAGEQNSALAWGSLGKDCECVLIGSPSGQLKAIDVGIGEIKWSAKEEGGVGGLCWSGDAFLVANGSDCTVGRVDKKTGKVAKKKKAGKNPAKCLLAIPGQNRVLIGNATLALWDMESGEQIAKFSGHSTPVTSIALSPDSKYGLTTADGDRHIAVWNLVETTKKKNKSICTMSMGSPVVHAHTLPLSKKSEKESGAFAVLGVSKSGVVQIWKCKLKKTKKLEATPWAVIQIDAEGKSKYEGILSARLEKGAGGLSVLVARGNAAKTAFERVNVPAIANDTVTINLDPLKEGLVSENQNEGSDVEKSKRKKRKRAVVLGPDNAGDEIKIRALGNEANGGEVLENGVVADAEMDALPDKKVVHATKMTEEDMMLGARVQALERRAANLDEQPGKRPKMKLNADSLSVLVSQAIKSEDNSMLDALMQQARPRARVSTCQGLSHVDAAEFMKRLIHRFQTCGTDTDHLLRWIKPLLHYHAGYLMSAPGMRQQLSWLYQAVDARLANFSALLSLSGRLKLLSAQIQMRKAAEKNANSMDEDVPGVIIKVGDSDDEDDDDGFEQEDVEIENVIQEDGGLSEDGLAMPEDSDSDAD